MRKDEQHAAGLGRLLLTLCLAAPALLAAACSEGRRSDGQAPTRQGELAEAFSTTDAGNTNTSTEPLAEQAAGSPAAARPAASKQSIGAADMRYRRGEEGAGSETYDRIDENGFVEAARRR